MDIDKESIAGLGRYHLVVCSNVLEHLSEPEKFCAGVDQLLCPDGVLYLSWTNWLSPWGGHEFSPLHYLGARVGPAVYDRMASRPRFHQPFRNLFPTYIGAVLRWFRRSSTLEISAIAPRYYTELSFIMYLPWIREFVAWNCALLIRLKR